MRKANSSPVRAKVCTSSIQTATPAARQRSISAAKNSRGATWKPPSPCTSSKSIAATRPGWRARCASSAASGRAIGSAAPCVVERHQQHVAPQRQPFAVAGPVGQLGEGRRAPREAALEGDDAVRRRVLLEDHLQRVLVGHGAGDREPDVAQPRARQWRSSASQSRAYSGPGRQVALEDGVDRRRDHRGLEQVAVGVTEGVDAEAAREVEAPGAVGEAHPRAAPAGAEQERQRERAAPGALQPLQRPGVRLAGERCGATPPPPPPQAARRRPRARRARPRAAPAGSSERGPWQQSVSAGRAAGFRPGLSGDPRVPLSSARG